MVAVVCSRAPYSTVTGTAALSVPSEIRQPWLVSVPSTQPRTSASRVPDVHATVAPADVPVAELALAVAATAGWVFHVVDSPQAAVTR